MADQPPTKQISQEEAIKIIYLAKHAGSGKLFPLFQQQVKDEKIPWSFTNPTFLQKIQDLKSALATELAVENEAQINDVADEAFTNTLSPEEREGVLNGFAAIRSREQKTHKEIFHHTESIVGTFVSQLKKQGILVNEQQQADILASSAEQIKDDPQKTQEYLVRAATIANIPTDIAVASAKIIPPADIEEPVQTLAHLSDVTETAFSADDTVQVSTLINQCVEEPTIPPSVIAEKYRDQQQVEKAISLPVDIQTSVNNALEDPATRKLAFQEAVASANAGISQPIGDVVEAIMGPGGKHFVDDTLETILGSSIKELEQSKTLGGTPVRQSPLFQQKLQMMEASFAKHKQTRQDAAAKVSVIMDAARPHKPTSYERAVKTATAIWTPKIQSGIRTYIESTTVHMYTSAPTGFQYIMIIGTDIWNSLVGKATNKVAEKAVETVLAGAAKKGAQAAATTAGKTAITAAAATGGTILAGPLGTALAWFGTEVVGRAWSFVWRGIKKIFSMAQISAVANTITNAFGTTSPSEKQWYEEISIVLPGVIAFVIIFSFSGFITLQDFTLFRETVISSAIVSEKEKTTGTVLTGRGFPHGDPESDEYWNSLPEIGPEEIERRRNLPHVDYCKENPTAAVCNIASLTDYCKANPVAAVCNTNRLYGSGEWPTISGFVSQGPGGSDTHKNGLNAVDITGPIIQTPIFAFTEHDGWIVVERRNEFSDESGYAGSSDGYGNYVVLQAPEGGYKILYAHLAENSMPAQGSVVEASQVIGRMGETGNTSGVHTHIEILGGGPSILSLLPETAANTFGCSSVQDCGVGWNNSTPAP